MTYGKETAPVQVVNAFDYEYPSYVEYSSERIAGAGVHLNTDDEFLVGCDCVDDCRVSCAVFKTSFVILFCNLSTNPIGQVKVLLLAANIFRPHIYKTKQRRRHGRMSN